MKIISFQGLILLLLLGCASVKPKGEFSQEGTPAPPNYAQVEYWAALPQTEDPADLTPNGLENRQSEAEVDVFFLHPTIYTGKKGDNLWNGPVDDEKLNERVDSSTIKYQASIFNGVGRVYAPRYRQAHYNAYFTKKEASAKEAFQIAYRDVRAAFVYYLEHYNKGRPIIIAAHSQGTTHAKALLKEFFDGKTLQNRLVAAYLVGIPILKKEFKSIPVCESPIQTGCFCSWRTHKYGKRPRKFVSPSVAVTNPLNWSTDDQLVPRSVNEGAVLKKFYKILPNICDAQIVPELGILWTHRPKVFGSIFFGSDYHTGDYNLYYLDVRKNLKTRVSAFWKR